MRKPVEMHIEGKELMFMGLAVEYFCMCSALAATALSGDEKAAQNASQRKLTISMTMTELLSAEEATALISKVSAWADRAAAAQEAEAGDSTYTSAEVSEPGAGGYL